MSNHYRIHKIVFARLPLALILALFALAPVVQAQRASANPVLAPDVSDIFVDQAFTPATPGWGVTHFDTIQEGIDAALPGQTVEVAVGDYAEALTIQTSITLIGARDGEDPREWGASGRPGGETVILPPAVAIESTQIVVLADDVTIDGFTLDAINPALGTDPARHVGGGIANGTEDEGYTTPISGLVISNNIFKNHNLYGVTIASSSETPRSNHAITRNLFDNSLGGQFAFGSRRGLQLLGNQYANITENKLTNVRIGVVVGRFNLPNPGPDVSISGNDLITERDGIWLHTITGTASRIAVDMNTFRTVTGSAINKGVRINFVRGNPWVSLTNNIIHPGAVLGVEISDVSTPQGVRVQNLSIDSPLQAGINIYNREQPSSNHTRVLLDSVTVSASPVGIVISDTLSRPIDSTLAVTVTNNSAITGSVVGIFATGSGASANVLSNDNGIGISTNTTGIDVRSGARLNLTGNRLVNNGIGVRFLDGGIPTALSQNFITGSIEQGILITGTVAGGVWPALNNNSFSGNLGPAVENTTAMTVNMPGNWWGSSDVIAVDGAAGGGVDYSPWLNTGTDTNAAPGFQGSFASLTVADIPVEVHPSPLQEGFDLAGAGGNVNVLSGSYTGGLAMNRNVNVTLNDSVTIAGNVNQIQGALTAPSGDLILNGSFTRSGGTFNANLGTVQLLGAGQQVVGGSAATVFNNLLANNVAGVEMAGPADVQGLLTLSNTVLDVNTFDLTLGAASTIDGTTPGAANMIVAQNGGRLCKRFTGPGSFSFPIGDTTGAVNFSPADLQLAGGTYTNGKVCVTVTDAPYPANFALNYLTRYWTVAATGISGYSANLTLQYGADSEDVTGVEASMIGLGYDGNLPVLNGNPVDAANNRVSLTTADLDGIVFTAGNRSAVQLLSLTVVPVSVTSARMSWSVGAEVDLEGYYILRSTTTNPATAVVRQRIAPTGSNHSYTYLDTGLTPRVVYYYWLEARGLGDSSTVRYGPYTLDMFELYLPLSFR